MKCECGCGQETAIAKRQHCNATDRRTQWANISGEYRRDFDDYVELCVPCHRQFDKREDHDRR